MAFFQPAKRTGILIMALLLCMVQMVSAKTPVCNKTGFTEKQIRNEAVMLMIMHDWYYRILPEYMDSVSLAGWEGYQRSVGEFAAAYYSSLPINLPISVRVPGTTLYQAQESITFEIGFESEPGADFVAEIITQDVAPPTNNTVTANGNMNWTITRSYDARGKVASEQKQFFDSRGQLLQTQSRVKYRKFPSTVYTHTFASQSIQDVLGRPSLSTLEAPTDNSEFSYKPDFVRNGSGTAYDYSNFDGTAKTNNPDPIGGQAVKGTLGWYYSNNNDWESYTPTTSYPYNRQTYYSDGTGNVKKTAGAGELLIMGSNHEASSYRTPVSNELDHYLQVRNRFFSAEIGAAPGTMLNGAVQSIGRDANGRESVVIQDRNGKTLLAGRPGSELPVNNSASVEPGAVYYFRTFTSGNILISSANNLFYNMDTEQPVSIGTGGNIAPGYYKLVNTGSAPITLGYSNGYADVSYRFYNQLGQLIATIAPEGVKKLYGSGINSYVTKTAVPFITLYEYDLRGRMIKGTFADAGSIEYVYRKDGKIRFSQNDEQKTNNRYSYTNYDVIGRLIESGEYLPDAGGIAFTSDLSVSSAMKNILENTSATGGLTTGTKTDVNIIKYDVPDNNPLSQYSFYLRGAVSGTSKYSSIVNNSPDPANLVCSTWYGYDEEGRVVGVLQSIAGLDNKETEYIYDESGRLIKKVFQRNLTSETFVHYFEYDVETHQLWKVYTNTVDNPATKQLQATYIYYLHGPLKRIELAADLQGIDYTYTLGGVLKAINNSDKTKDPGGDGSNGINADAFGMVLDYHTNDYVNNRGNIQPLKGVSGAGIGQDSYAGSIKAMTWFSRKPASVVGSTPGIEDPTTYVYEYDDKYQFTESNWFINTPAPFTSTGFNKEKVKQPGSNTPAYDANGNILHLERTGTTGTLVDRFTYNYLNTTTNTGSNTDYNSNRLESVVNDANGTPAPYAKYSYDKLGQLTMEDRDNGAIFKYIKYDVTGNVLLVARNSNFTQKIVEYVYDETGQRIKKKLYNSSFALSQITYYVGDVIYTQQVNGGIPNINIIAQEYAIQGISERLGVYYRQSNIYAYELKDHLGNVRAVVAKNGSATEVRTYADYYPYGLSLRQYESPEGYRYGYQGQYAEKDKETDWNAFNLRMYDSRIARWLSVDPYNESWSPYMGMANDPVNGVDPDGGSWWDWVKAQTYAFAHGARVYHETNSEGKSFYNVVKGNSNGEGPGVKLLRSYRDYGYVGKVSWKVTVGAQAAMNWTTPIVGLKIDAKLISYELTSAEYDFINNKYTPGEHTIIGYQHNGVSSEQSVGIELELFGKYKFGYKPKKTFLTEPTYNGIQVIKGSVKRNVEDGVYLKIPHKFSPGSEYAKPDLKWSTPSIKGGVTDDGSFFGLDIGATVNAVFGAEVKLKLGWYY
jgi:RHS repeat-associated protein